MGRVRPCIALGGLSWVQKFGPKSVSESDHKALFLSAARATVTAHLDLYWCKPSQKSQRARTSFPEGRQCVRACVSGLPAPNDRRTVQCPLGAVSGRALHRVATATSPTCLFNVILMQMLCTAQTRHLAGSGVYTVDPLADSDPLGSV